MSNFDFKPLLIAILAVLTIGFAVIALEAPTGSVIGAIGLEQQNISTEFVRTSKVYVLATGLGNDVERGTWVNPGGKFKLSNLPIGSYTLSIKAKGFASETLYDINIADGGITELGASILLKHLEPNINFGSSTHQYTNGEKPYFWVNGSGIDKLEVRIYPIDYLALNDKILEGLKKSLYNLSVFKEIPTAPIPWKERKPLLTLKRNIADASDWTRQEFKLDEPLPPGDYLMVGEGQNMRHGGCWNASVFTVSNLGLVIKQSPQELILRAVDLDTLKSRPSTNIKIFRRNEQTLGLLTTMTTDEEGLLHYTLPPGGYDYMNLLAVAEDAGDRAYGFSGAWRESTDQFKTYFYTDKPVYRLGQTVLFKGIMRRTTRDQLQNPGELNINIKFEDPDGNQLAVQTIKTTPHGTFHGEFNLPTTGKTGAYTAYIDDGSGFGSYQYFEVAQYRKPEYAIDIVPDSKAVLLGEEAKVTISANYYFGAPVTGAKVEYSVFVAPDWNTRLALMERSEGDEFYDGWEDYEEGDADYQDGYSGDYVLSGSAITNENGRLNIKVNTDELRKLFPKQDYPPFEALQEHRLTFQVKVLDASGRAVINRAGITVLPAEYALTIKPKRYIYKTGEEVLADIKAINYNGSPISAGAKIVCKLNRALYKSGEPTPTVKVLSETLSITDADGVTRCKFKLNDGNSKGDHYITAQSTDSKGSKVGAHSYLWIYSSKDGTDSPETATQTIEEPLKIKLDKSIYRPGDVARILIDSPIDPLRGAFAQLSIEAGCIHLHKLIELNAHNILVEVPVLPEYAPNVYVAVTAVGSNRQFHHSSKLLKVSPQNNFLKISLEYDKPSYGPGEQANLKIHADRADGKPAENVELSVGVVDESIYAIRPETTEDIRSFFYDKRFNSVQTLCSFPEEYSGGSDKLVPSFRRNFKDTAAWFPSLITDSEGNANVSFVWPDNLTSWLSTARGIGMQTQVGSTSSTIKVAKDLVAQLALPRFYTATDQSTLTGSIHNYTTVPQKVDVKIESNDALQIQGDEESSITIKPQEVAHLTWTVKATKAQEGIIKFSAIGAEISDAIELSLPILPYSFRGEFISSGKLGASETATITPKVADGAMFEDAEVTISNGILGDYSQNLDYLLDYPHGCTEQTVSRLMPALIVKSLNERLNLKISAEQNTKIQNIFERGMSQLRLNRNVDGGWSWWSGSNSDTYLTSYVMEALYGLKAIGHTLPSEWFNEGAQSLKTSLNLDLQSHLYKKANHQLKRAAELDELITFAYGLYSLQLIEPGSKLEAVRDHLRKQIDQLPPEALAYYSMYEQLSGSKELAQKILNRLRELGQDSSLGLNWDYNLKLGQKLGLKPDAAAYGYTDRFTGAESTALALMAIALIEAQSTDELESISEWLTLQRERHGWGNTKATSTVLLALSKAIPSSGAIQQPSVAAMVGEDIFKIFDSSENPVLKAIIPAERIKNNSLVLKHLGGSRGYYSLLIPYVLPLATYKASLPSALPSDLHFESSFHKLKPTNIVRDGRLVFGEEPLKQAKSGETILQKITIDTPVKLPFVMINAPLASGTEVIAEDDAEGNNLTTDSNTSNIIDSWLKASNDSVQRLRWSHRDIQDDEQVIFLTEVPAGRSELNILIRAELAGEYRVRPCKLQTMYSQRVRAYTPPDTLKVSR